MNRDFYAYLTLSTSALDRVLREATLLGVHPIWLLAGIAAEMLDGCAQGRP
jgi:hypothetical protein